MNIPKQNIPDANYDDMELPEKWILSRLSKMINDYNDHLDRFHFNESAKSLYDFVWNDFCDWYVEIAKTRFYSEDENRSNVTRFVAIKCIRSVLILLHPFSPFITEELWSSFKREDDGDIIIF